MAMKRSRPNSGGSKGGRVGPEYAEEKFVNPFNNDLEHWYEAGDGKRTLVSPNEETVTGAGLKLHKGKYEKYFEGH